MLKSAVPFLRLTGCRIVRTFLTVWDDTGGTSLPGAMIFEGDFELVGSNTAMHELGLAGENVFVPAQFRVGIEFQHKGLPSIARDADGQREQLFRRQRADIVSQ